MSMSVVDGSSSDGSPSGEPTRSKLASSGSCPVYDSLTGGTVSVSPSGPYPVFSISVRSETPEPSACS